MVSTPVFERPASPDIEIASGRFNTFPTIIVPLERVVSLSKVITLSAIVKTPVFERPASPDIEIASGRFNTFPTQNWVSGKSIKSSVVTKLVDKLPVISL